jgi:hypothetical protein
VSGPFGGARLDLELRRGARFYQRLDYTDSDGTAPDLTGYTARLDIRANTDIAPASAGTAILQFSTTPTGSQGTITLGSTETVTLTDGSTATARIVDLDASATLGIQIDQSTFDTILAYCSTNSVPVRPVGDVLQV